MKNRFIMGKNCLSEVLKKSPERLVQVYTCQKPIDPFYQELIRQGIKVISRSKQQLFAMVESDSHQSYVAEIKERENIFLKDFIAQEKDPSVVLMLDSIFDPHNMGAILRSAECFGVDLVVYSKNRGADVTPVVSKVSVGASELVPMAKVSNLAEAMNQFQKGGYWAVAADVGKGSTSLHQFEFPEKTVLILGSEGKGVQPLLLKKCDAKVYIPMQGQIDSLNVSQAAAVFLSHCRKEK